MISLLKNFEADKSVPSNYEESLKHTKEETAVYIENKFITEDGFQLGYYVSFGYAPVCYMSLERHGSDSTIYFDGVVAPENALLMANKKIQELK